MGNFREVRGAGRQGKQEELQIYFWRTAAGAKVDLVVEKAGRLIPVEVKLSATPSPQAAKGMESFHKDFPQQARKGYVVHPGATRLSLSPRAWAWPFAEL
jgi:predicted AAA+ superfamily ATPase